MKNIVLSADGERKVYSVPEAVADCLYEYCLDFEKWIQSSPNAKKYRTRRGYGFDEDDFIEYLNTWIFPEQKSVLVENLGWIDFESELPKPYTGCPQFNF